MQKYDTATESLQTDNCSVHSLKIVKRWPSDAAREWVEHFVEIVYHQPEICAIVLFGSVVCQVDYSADVDLLLVYEKEKPEFSTPPLDVDVRAYPRIDVDSLIADGHELLGWAILFGRVVYEKDQYWTNLCKRWKTCLPLPSAETSDRRAEKARQLFEDLKGIGDDDAAEDQYVIMLTHLARARLIRTGIYPASRPELPGQLKEIEENEIASQLANALLKRRRLAV